jgi:selenocysteine lyase/cysteine desulfurase
VCTADVGGGTVSWTNPWGEHKYIDNIEDREDGGTPGFLQVMKTALAIQLKEKMGVQNILDREHEIVDYIFEALGNIDKLHILANQHQDRLGVISFYIDDLHYNLGVKLLNDKFGVGPHTISVPRIRPADDIDPDDFENAINDDIFEKIVAILRIAVPYTGIIVSTRETQESRERVLKVGVSQISGASSTSVGGYAEKEKPEDNSAQFEN